MSDADVPWQLLERYCSGHVTPEDAAQLEAWLAADPRRRVLMDRLRALVSRQVLRPTESDIERAWERLAETLERGPTHTWLRWTRGRWSRLLVMSAAVLILLGIAWYLARVTVR